MLSIDIKLSVINKYFVDGKGYKRIAKELNISRDTVRSTICRYRKQKGIPLGIRDGIINNPLEQKDILSHIKTLDPDIELNKRIADLEMQVELLRNFLVLGEGR